MQCENRRLLYFAYGEHIHEEEMLRDFPHARMVGLSRLHGYALCFVGRDGMARAGIVPGSRVSVVGRVWSLCEQDADGLDRHHQAPYAARPELMMLDVDGMKVPVVVYVTAQGQPQGRPGFVTYDLMREAYEGLGEGAERLRDLAMASAPV